MPYTIIVFFSKKEYIGSSTIAGYPFNAGEAFCLCIVDLIIRLLGRLGIGEETNPEGGEE
jgi:hypothetical protein